MKRIGFALAFSLLLHLVLLSVPAWRLPSADKARQVEPAPLQARLAAPEHKAVPPVRKLRPLREAQSVRRAPVLAAPAPAHVAAELPPAAVTEQDRAGPVAAAAPAPAPPVPAAPAAAPAQPSAPQPEPLLPRHGVIRFSIMRGDQGFVIGQAVQRWTHDEQNYEISSVTETTGLAALFAPVRVTQTSIGEMTPEGLKPLEYRTARNGVATEAASFDWSAQKLRYSGERNAPLSPGSQDMLSLFYQLGEQVVRGRTDLLIATGKKYERYTFASLGEEKLATRFGEQRVLHLRTVGESGSEATEIWVGLDLHGLPLKIRYTDRNGDSYQQVAEGVEFDDNRPAIGGDHPETGR